MKLRSFKLFVLLILFLQSCLLFSQTIKSINVKSNDGHQNIKFDPQSNIGLNYIQLYRSTKAVSFKFIVELEGDNLPEQMIMRTNTDKGPSYIHSLVNSLNTPREDQNSLENSIRHIIDILPKENTEPFLMSQSENPEFPVELYKDIPMKRTSMQNSGHVVYESAYLPVEFDQTSNAIFELKDRDGALKPVPLYYESSVHNKNIFVLNLVVSPKEASSIKIATVNPIQLGDVTDEKNATSFKVVDREKWKKLYLSGNTEANEKDLFVYEKFPVKSEVTQKMGFLKAKQLDSPSMVDRIIKTANETNANTVWLMPINENSPLRMSPELKEARMVKIGDQYYLVSNILQTRDPETGEKTGIELPHKGLYYQHETVAYSVSKYFGGNEAASSLIGQLNNAGLRVMVEEHPDKISSFGLEYSDLSPQAESIIKSILKVAGYEMAPESIGHPLNILTSKLKKISDGTEIFAYQFFTLKYNYDGKDVDKNSPDYVLKQNRLPGGPDEMPTKISEIYTTAIGRPGDDWATFVQLRVNNPYVELIEMIAKIDYYKRLFVKANQAAIRIDAVHFGLLRYDERSQFIRYLNEIRQTFPDIIIAGEVIADGVPLGWLAMPLDVTQPVTLLHRDEARYKGKYGRTNFGHQQWEDVVGVLRNKNKVYFCSLTSYDTCPAVSEYPFNIFAMLERAETYSNQFEAYTKEAYVYFAPSSILSLSAGEELGTTNDFKNFKADQFQYYHLPYEEGNFDQTRVDLVSTYPVVDDVKKFLKDEKYGYNLKAMNVDVLEKGYLTAQSYVSDKGVVIILRNTGTHEFPMKHDFGKEIPREIDKRKMAYENLHVIFDSYETEYNTSNRANLYKPNESLLFNKYDFQDDVLELERNLKPYEVIVLATVDKGELQELRGKYIKAILAEDMSISYKDKTTSEIVDLWLLRLPSEGNKVKAPNVFNKILVEDGLLEWMHNDNSNPKRKEQISFLINITNAFQNSSFNRKERTVIDYYKASSTGFASPVKVETFNKRLLNYYENAFSSKIEEKEFLDDVVKKVIDYIILKDNLGNEELDILLLSDENDKSLLNYMIEEAKKGNDGYKYKLALVDLMFDLNLPKIVSATPYFARYNEFKLESAKDITIKITIDELEKERKKIEEKLSLDRGFIK